MKLSLPDMSLVVLIGASGSGKSTFAHRHFLPTQILSSDFFRGLVSDDETDQSATNDAFETLHYVAGKRLAAGRMTVIDATNVQRHARESLIKLAREHHVLPVAIVLDMPESLCLERNEHRPDRNFGPHVVRRHRNDLRRSLKSLQKEGFRRVHVLKGIEDAEAAEIAVEPLLNDKRDQSGPFDVIGDVHGCRAELEELLENLGYVLERDEQNRPVNAAHPHGRQAVFVGDLVDRGPDTPGVLRLVMGMVDSGNALCVCGNHEQKLARKLNGRNVRVGHGLAETLEQLETESAEFREQVREFCDGLIAHYVLDGGDLVVAHAGLPAKYHGRASGAVRSFALFGDTTGETDEYGLPVRYPWAQDYRGKATVLYGHVPTPEAEWVNNTMCLDTGCAFGGKLTTLRYPERELVSVKAHRTWYEPVKPLLAAEDQTPSPEGTARREPELLNLADVTGRRSVETRYAGAVSVMPDRSAAALEVMSRFAVDPRWLVYLPPTMAPVETSQRQDLLEHPEEAFSSYRSVGVQHVVCEEKHMGSRAVLLVCRNSGAERLGIDGLGAVFTRTGRSFFEPERTEQLLERVREAVSSAGLWEELGTDWIMLDAELLPWSAKAGALIMTQYASVGAAAEAALPVAGQALASAVSRGIPVGDLHARTTARLTNASAFRDAYRRYCWPTDGLDGISVAPFQVLASEGSHFHETEHAWHLAIADRLAEADPTLFTTTRRFTVDTTDPQSTQAATEWWEEMTAAGGEGMVVKPAANLTKARKGLAQPGLKVRGREYLRIIYGPDYTEPHHLERLRQRSVGRKRGLASREYALGLEALERLARGEPLWRIHECVFAILALESEPVDPRL